MLQCIDACLHEIPIELHGHRKKVTFLVDRIEALRRRCLPLNKEINILEVGCSNGVTVSIPLARMGYAVKGIDPHKPSIDMAISLSKDLQVTFEPVSVEGLDAEEKYDVVILSDVLEHVPDPHILCAKSAAKLKPNGILLISVPNGFGLYEIEKFIVKWTGLGSLMSVLRTLLRPKTTGVFDTAYNYDSPHIQFFSHSNILDVIRHSDLKVTKFQNGCLLGGDVTMALLGRSKQFVVFSLRLADKLPKWAVSTWYFECRKQSVIRKSVF